MNSLRVLVAVFLLASALTVHADTYIWTDDEGTVNFTDNPSDIPAKKRKKAVQRRDMESSVSSDKKADAPAASPAAAKPSAPAVAGKESAATDKNQMIGGKSYAQWEREMADQVQSLSALRKRIDEMDAELKNPKLSYAQIQQMTIERNQLVKQYNDKLKQHDQFVESARKAGLTVDTPK